MKRALALFFTALLALGLRAGETTISFAGAGTSASGSNWNGTNNWVNLTTKKAKARLNGIGIAPTSSSGGQSGLKATFDPPESMVSLSITCMASGTTAAKATHLLGVRLNSDELMTAEVTFPDQAVDTPVTLTFSFTEKQSVETLAISNETTKGSSLFEVNAVSWQSDFAPISANYANKPICNVGEAFYAALSECTGGSGEYTSFRWRFNGLEQEASDYAAACRFTAPMEEGLFPLELEVTDSLGTVANFSWDITVRPYIKATNLACSNLTRTGMTVSWEQPLPYAVSDYLVRVSYATQDACEQIFAPTWVREGDSWQLAEPIDLTDFIDGRNFTAYLASFHWQGEGLEVSTDGGTTWCAATCLSTSASRYILLHTLEDGSRSSTFTPAHAALLLRTAAETPPDFFRLHIDLPASLITSKTLPAESNALQVTFHESEDDVPLPAGKLLSVSILTRYLTDSGKFTTRQSSTLKVTLPAIPPMDSATCVGNFLSLTWPEEASTLPAKVTFFKRTPTPTDGLPALLLSRLYFTGNATDVGGEQLAAGKAFVLTNTTRRPIALKGDYTFTITKAGTATAYTWDFSLTETDETGKTVKTYPYVVPAGGEVLFYASAYAAPTDAETFESAIGVSASALRNLNTTYTATFAHQGETIATFTPQFNTILRLRPNDPSTQAAYLITSTDTTLPALYIPWFTPYRESILRQTTVNATGSSALLAIASLLAEPGDAQAIWASIRLREGNSYSTPLSLTLWEREDPKAGLRFLFY
ncbi:MAG: hypothetical protein ACI4RT_07955 [Candidatus Spyradenecus sp.]